MDGIGHSYFVQIHIHGFSIFMTIPLKTFQYGSIVGGPYVEALPLFFFMKQEWDEIFEYLIPLIWTFTQRNPNCLGYLMLLGFSTGNIISRITCRLHSHYPWFESIRFNGGMNLRQSSMEKKMLLIFLLQILRSSPCTTCNKLKP